MKKIIKIVIIILIVAAIGAVAWIYMDRDDGTDFPTPPSPTPTPVGKTWDVTVQDVVVENKTDNRYVNCVYPKITSLNNKEFQNYINTQIAKNINEYRSEIEYIIDDETKPTEMYTYITKYDKYVSNKYLSLVIDQDYQTGGIRSNKWKDIYNINLDTDRIFYLEELFEPGVKYEDAIIKEITKQADAKNIELMGGNGITKIPQKQKFYIKDNKLTIYYDPSEGAATVFGELHFEMPFTMNENGIFEI